MAMLNTLDGTRDDTGHDDTPWATWTRKWIAEENRHGDAMNKYLWLTGRVDMRAVEVTIRTLIGSGMDPKTENNPYLGFVFTSFQERATKVAHGNTARFAKEKGDPVAAKARARTHWRGARGAAQRRSSPLSRRSLGVARSARLASPPSTAACRSRAQMLGLIAADEGRHETAYQRIIEEILRRDPEGAWRPFPSAPVPLSDLSGWGGAHRHAAGR